MTKYYTKIYITYSLIVFVILLFFGQASDAYSSTLEMLIKSFVFSGLISLYLINRLFHQKNLWVFIDNLQVSRTKLRLINLLFYLTVTISLSIAFTKYYDI